MGPDERRAAAFAGWFDERTCTSIEPWRWGSVYLDAEFPGVSDSNFLSVDAVPDAEAPDLVVEEAERVRLATGIPRRRVVVADMERAEHLVSAFEAGGWVGDRYRLMVQRRRPATAGEELRRAVADMHRTWVRPSTSPLRP